MFQGPNCIEIWSEEVWNDYFNDVNFECLADALDVLKQEIARLNQDYAMDMAVLRQKDEYMMQTLELCNEYASSRVMKMNHLKNRIVKQLFQGL